MTAWQHRTGRAKKYVYLQEVRHIRQVVTQLPQVLSSSPQPDFHHVCGVGHLSRALDLICRWSRPPVSPLDGRRPVAAGDPRRRGVRAGGGARASDPGPRLGGVALIVRACQRDRHCEQEPCQGSQRRQMRERRPLPHGLGWDRGRSCLTHGQFQDKSPGQGNHTISDFAENWCIRLSSALISIFKFLMTSLNGITRQRLMKIKLEVKHHHAFSFFRHK